MRSSVHAFEPLAPLNNPLLVGAFIARGGFSAAAAVGHLIAQWEARPVADIDPDHYYDFNVVRPGVQLDDGERRIEWPETRFFVARPPGSDRDVVLLMGVEPHYHWRDFAEAIDEVATQLGVTERVLLTVRPGPTPHTRPVPVHLRHGDARLALQFGVPLAGSDYEGPTSITGVLSVRDDERGGRGGVLTAVRPFYIGIEPSPHAVAALCETIARGLGTTVDTSPLLEAASAIDRQFESAVERSAEPKTFVQELERQCDAALVQEGQVRVAPESEAPDTDALFADIERFLRRRGAMGRGETPRTH